MTQQLSIAFVGMTHLGLISATCAAEKEFNIVCFDSNKALVNSLSNQEVTVNEPKLLDLLKKNRNRMLFTSEVNDLKKCSLIYVSPDIKTNDQGESDLNEINYYLNKLSQICYNEDAIFVILSQVPPGFTRQLNWDKSRLFYQVETLIFGQAIERSLYPERYTIGVDDQSKPLPEILLTFLSAFRCPILKMKYESAELSKIAINMFLVSSITTTNTISELCEKIGANWFEIVETLKLDKRIGKHAYLAPGLGIAGGNLERDMTTFNNLSNELGTEASIVDSWKQNSQKRKNWVLKEIYRQILPSIEAPTFGILGLAYKKDTSSIKNSPSVNLLSALNTFSKKVFDPVVKSLPDHLEKIAFVNTAEDAFRDVDVLLIMTPWDEFKKLQPDRISATLRGTNVIDPYGVLDKEECLSKGLNYSKLGI